MNKTTVVVSCPIDTYSGYGARARDFVKALDKSKYDVKILAQRWGSTRFGYLEDHKEVEIQSLIVPKLTSQPDVWIQVTIPNEFQKVGKFNIGLTAGMETDICAPEWVQGCNNMDLVLTSSEHGKNSLVNSKYTLKDNSELKVNTPVEVLFEGVDLSKYFETSADTDEEIVTNLDTIEESFCYLFVGHWLQGAMGHDRKNVGWMIKVFLETFKNKKNAPALILKTQHANASITDKEALLKKIDSIRKQVAGSLPNVYVIHGELTDAEINQLYNHRKVKAMINFTKGEGFGRPLLEFTTSAKPIIASGWSGHLDFLNQEFVSLLNGTLHQVDRSAVQKGMIIEQAKWFQADEASASRLLKDVHSKYKKYQELAKRQRHYTKTTFSLEMMAEKLDLILSQYLPEFPKQVELSLPKLELPKLNKL
jgi:glycosyltransferase involved in cell wall biosynthesis